MIKSKLFLFLKNLFFYLALRQNRDRNIHGKIPNETNLENSVWGRPFKDRTSLAATRSSPCCSSPFPQGLEAAHAAQHQLWVILVGVHFLIIGYKGILPLVQFLIPGGLDLLPSGKEGLWWGMENKEGTVLIHTLFPKVLCCMDDTSPITVCLGLDWKELRNVWGMLGDDRNVGSWHTDGMNDPGIIWE